MGTALAIVQALAALAGLLSLFLKLKQSAADRQAGRAEAQVEQAHEVNKAQERELNAQAGAPSSADDAIRRLEEGSA
jgi:hypothetical protein